MKAKDLSVLITVALTAAILSFFVAKLVFRAPAVRQEQVPTIPLVSTDFPDVYADPTYTLIFNNKALDPTQPVKIGNTSNTNPFNGQ